jgi:hypothetical protein
LNPIHIYKDLTLFILFRPECELFLFPVSQGAAVSAAARKLESPSELL